MVPASPAPVTHAPVEARLTGQRRILLVEDSPDDSSLLYAMLKQVESEGTQTRRAECLHAALTQLGEQPFDLILLDLGLPDSHGIETLERIQRAAPNVPIIVLSGLADLDISLQAVRRGAQDYLRKGSVSPEALVRAIGYAVERHRILSEVTTDALVDDLTGLYNRRGLTTLAAPIMKTAVRHTKGLTVLFIDLDGLKPINDTLGHEVGNQALTEMADVLRENFRQADVLARIGGDEFVVLAVGAAAEDGELLATRLQATVAQRNARPGRAYNLALSVGVSQYDPRQHPTLDALLVEADHRMYHEKRRKRAEGSQADVRASAATVVTVPPVTTALASQA